jgi:hypothetical protein
MLDSLPVFTRSSSSNTSLLGIAIQLGIRILADKDWPTSSFDFLRLLTLWDDCVQVWICGERLYVESTVGCQGQKNKHFLRKSRRSVVVAGLPTPHFLMGKEDCLEQHWVSEVICVKRIEFAC